jgi:hypothetical protein
VSDGKGTPTVLTDAGECISAAEHKCPFYGYFAMTSFGMVPQHGNACALNGMEHRPAPCEPNPDWDTCPRNGGLVGPGFFATQGDLIKVFSDGGPSVGVTLNAWYKQVMGRDPGPDA